MSSPATAPLDRAAINRAAFDQHCRQFSDEYRPATASRSHPHHQRQPPSQLADPQPSIHSLSMLGLHGARLSRQFQKTLQQLRQLQAERRGLQRPAPKEAPKEAAAPSREPSKAKGIPKHPTHAGFVFSEVLSKDQPTRAPI